MGTDYRLQVDGLGKAFGRRSLCHELSACIETGEIVAVVGPNGSGKTTLLNMIAGLTRPDSGQISHTVRGVVVPRHIWHRHMGYVSLEMAVYDELSGAENLQFVVDALALDVGSTTIQDILSELGLVGRGGDRVATYSSGMKHRLKLCAALLRSPSLLVLDEPSAMLDDDGQAQLWTAIARRGPAVVFATNQSAEVERVSRQIRLGAHANA